MFQRIVYLFIFFSIQSVFVYGVDKKSSTNQLGKYNFTKKPVSEQAKKSTVPPQKKKTHSKNEKSKTTSNHTAKKEKSKTTSNHTAKKEKSKTTSNHTAKKEKSKEINKYSSKKTKNSNKHDRKILALTASAIYDVTRLNVPQVSDGMGFAISAELLLTDTLSFYTEYTSANQSSNNMFMADFNVKKIFIGSRINVKSFYIGLGGVKKIIDYDDTSTTDEEWNFYTQLGNNFKLSQNLSIDVGLNIIWNPYFYGEDGSKKLADTTFYMGLRYLI